MSILSTTLKKSANGSIIAKRSSYNPGKKEKEAIAMVVNAFSRSHTIQNKSYREFNDMSLLQRQSRDQKSFNAWQETRSADPDDEWKSRAVRPIVRNKIISIAAHITSQTIFPKVFAQNKNDEEDRDAALVMRDLMEYAGEEGDYELKFLHAVVAALVNPATIVNVEFNQTIRRIKDIQEDGNWKEKDVLDELFSGFTNNIVPVDELYIENIYESNIQKQGYLIWRKVISFSTAQAKYNTNQKFIDHVRAGIQVMAGEDGDTFYDEHDTDMSDQEVEEIIYWERNSDLRLVFVNGILLTEPDQPNPRDDKTYPFSKTGYELIDEGKFFYYRSLANKTSVDEEVVNTLYRMIIDGTYLQLWPPSALYGDEEVDSSVIAPGIVNSFDKDTKLEKIELGGNLSDGRSTLEKVEQSISESSVDRVTGGQTSGKTPATAFELSRVEQNARIMLGLFGKMIGFLVKDWGYLMIGDIKQFATVADYMNLTSEGGALKFRNILLPEKTASDGSKKTRKIEFNHELPTGGNEKQTVKESFRILQEESKRGANVEISKVNPALFRNLKFKLYITPELVAPVSDNVEKAFNLEAYDRAIANPLANQESIFKDLLLGSYDKTKDDPDKYINNKPENPIEGQLAALVGADKETGK